MDENDLDMSLISHHFTQKRDNRIEKKLLGDRMQHINKLMMCTPHVHNHRRADIHYLIHTYLCRGISGKFL